MHACRERQQFFSSLFLSFFSLSFSAKQRRWYPSFPFFPCLFPPLSVSPLFEALNKLFAGSSAADSLGREAAYQSLSSTKGKC